MKTAEIIEYWKAGSKNDLRVAIGLFRLKHYSHCLFFCHLALEKIMKAVYVKRRKAHAPYIHDLIILCRKAKIPLTKEQTDHLETITSFNIQGRYADYKSHFYKTFNKQSTAKQYLNITHDLTLWLGEFLTRK